jgi:hypothetical protein
LRQRKLQMPMAMTGTWIGMGTGLVVALLLLALLIPRPQGEYTLTALVDKIDAKAREASRFAVLKGDRGQGEGRRIGEQDQKADKPGEGQQRQDPQQANEKQPGQGQGGGKQGEGKQGEGKQGGEKNRDGKDQAKGGDKQADGKDGKNADGQRDGEAGQKQEQAAAKPQPPENQGQRGAQAQNPQPQNRQPQNAQPQNQNQAQPNANRPPEQNPGANTPSSPSSLLTQLAPLVKWILYGLMAAVVLYVAMRYWSRIVEILRQLWAELLSLFGFKQEPAAGAATEVETPAAARLLPFAAYEDPFFSGAARNTAPAKLVRYTFEALEAWAREQVVARPSEQTPLEFAQELGRRVPALAKDVTQTAQLYVQIAYARQSPSKDALEILERMWRRMHVGAHT